MTGLSLTIYRPDFGKNTDCTAGGATSPQISKGKILVLFDDEIPEGNYRLEDCRDNDRIICLKVVRRWVGTPNEYLHVEPMFDKNRGEGMGPMAGGNYVGTGDTRFRRVSPGLLSVHDRWEN